MPSAPKAPPKPAPITQAVGVDDQARRQAELERRRRGGYYAGYKASSNAEMVGGSGEQTLG